MGRYALMIVGLTGKSCSGKDKFASLLDSSRFTVIDEDEIGHIALDELKAELVSAFGDGIITSGRVDRKKLSPIVFSSSSELEKLNSIVHPWMVDRTLKMCSEIEETGKIAVINAAILQQMGFVPYCDQIILVISDLEKRIERAEKRDGITKEAFLKRAANQKGIGEGLFSSGKKVITIFNNGTEEQLSRQVEYYCANL